MRSATPRADGVLQPEHGIGSGRAVLDQSAVGQELRLTLTAHRSRNDASVHERHLFGRELQCWKSGVGLGDERRDFGRRDRRRGGGRDGSGLTGADEGAAAPGHERQHSAGRGRRCQRDVARPDRGDQVHRFQHRNLASISEHRHDARRPRARRVDRRACRNLERGSGERVPNLHPGDASAVAHGADRLGIVGEIHAASICGFRERERQPIRFDDLVVVPLSAARQAVRLDSLKEPHVAALEISLGRGRCSSGST